jgi:tetratricopeptide (TPR) repeat protein
VYLIVTVSHYKLESSINLDRLFSEIKALGEAENDRTLLACYYLNKDFKRFEETCATLPVTNDNFTLFASSKKHYKRLIEHLTGIADYRGAANIARMNDDFAAAAELYVKGKSYKEAAQMYEYAKQPDNVIECLQASRDLPAMAKAYEKIKEYDKALEIWKNLKRLRDVRRVETKIRVTEEERLQQLLF